MGLRSAFNKFLDNRRREKENDRRYNEARNAIAAGDVDALAQSLEGADFTQRDADRIFLDAIETDNAALFNCVLEKSGSGGPNRLFYTRHYNAQNNIEESMLYTAISRGKANVALALAENPKTNITRSGVRRELEGYRYSTPTEKPYSQTPLELARRQGMTEVVGVLARRTLELRQAEVAQLQKEAAAHPRAGGAKPG